MPASWNSAYESIPTDSNLAGEGAEEIRDFKENVKNKINNEHEFDYTDVTNQGRHKEGSARVLVDSGAAGAIADNVRGRLRTTGTDEGTGLEVYNGTEWKSILTTGQKLEQVYQKDGANGDLYTGSGSLYELSDPRFVSNKGELPLGLSAVHNGNSGQGKIFSNRGSWYFSGNESYAELPTQFQNEDSVEFWIFPNWGASPSENVHVIDYREATDDNNIRIMYLTTDVYRFRIEASSGNLLFIDSSIIANPNTVTHLKFSWSKSGNTCKAWINGIDQGAPTSNGSGISTINLDFTVNQIVGASHNRNSNFGSFWISDLLFHGSYDVSTAHYTAGVPYITNNRAMGKDTVHAIDEFGNVGANAVFGDHYGPKRVVGEVFGNGLTYGFVFSALEPYVPNVGDTLIVTGIIVDGTGANMAVKVFRSSATQIRVFTRYVTGASAGGSNTVDLVSGSGTTGDFSLAW